MANITNYPKIRPSLLLDFINSGRVDPRISCGRNTSASIINSRGLLEIVPANVARVVHDPLSLRCLGILNERDAGNYLLQSADLTQAIWGKSNATTAAEPTGGTKITFPGTDGYVQQTISLDNHTHTVTVLLGASSTGWARVTVASLDGASQAGTFVNTVTGALGQPVSTGGWPVTGVVSAKRANGDIQVSFTSVAVSAQKRIIISSVSADGGSSGTAGRTAIVRWAQSEFSTFPTSYIPTTTVAVQRSHENLLLTGTGFSDWFNPEGGTLVVAGVQAGNYGGWLAGFSSGNVSNRTGAVRAGGNLQGIVYDGGTEQANLVATGMALGARTKCAFTFGKNTFAMSVNGAAPITDALGSMPLLTQMSVGNAPWGASESFNGVIERVAYYPAQLTNSQIQALSAP